MRGSIAIPLALGIVALAGAGPADPGSPGDRSVSALIPYGRTFAKAVELSRRAGPGQTLAGTRAIVRTTPGSGSFGPASADYALMIGALKDGWATSAAEGEVDGAFIVTRQGKRGDASALLADVAKRRDQLTRVGADETGGALGAELGAKLIDAKGQAYHDLHTVIAFAEGPGGVSGGRGYGYWAHPERGLWYSAYAAQESGTAGGFLNYLTGARGANPASVNFRIDRNGTIFQGFGGAQTRAGYDAASGKWRLTDERGAAMLEVDRRAKVAAAPGGFRAGGGSTLAFLRAGTVELGLPALRGGTGALLGRQRLAGARVGDMVSVAPASPSERALGLHLTGVVVAPDVVALRAQNLDAAPAPAARLRYTIKVERFGA